MEQDHAIMYYCDPEKNADCRKSCCAHCMTIEEGGVCFITLHREFARTDANGDPVTYEPKRRKFPSGGAGSAGRQKTVSNFHQMEISQARKGKPTGDGVERKEGNPLP